MLLLHVDVSTISDPVDFSASCITLNFELVLFNSRTIVQAQIKGSHSILSSRLRNKTPREKLKNPASM